MSPAAHTWEFKARFRRHAFGWKSQPAITRIRQAVTEIRRAARKNPALGAEGAVLFLEKLSPALERIDSSSGAIGTAVARAIDELVPIIVHADVDDEIREDWLERLWQAIQDDDMPYIEVLGRWWGELCAHPHIASRWADEFLGITRRILSGVEAPGAYFKGTVPCLSALLAAHRYEELIALIGTSRQSKILWYRSFGARALAAMGRIDEAITMLESGAGINDSIRGIAAISEEILLEAGQTERAFLNYGFEANQRSTFLATFRALIKKYPDIEARDILNHCIDRSPGEEGKWFASARHAGFLDVAQHLATTYRVEPKTLVNAARDHVTKNPDFSIHAGLAALRNLDDGYGYDEPGPADVLSAYATVMRAAEVAGNTVEVKTALRAHFGQQAPPRLVWMVLEPRL